MDDNNRPTLDLTISSYDDDDDDDNEEKLEEQTQEEDNLFKPNQIEKSCGHALRQWKRMMKEENIAKQYINLQYLWKEQLNRKETVLSDRIENNLNTVLEFNKKKGNIDISIDKLTDGLHTMHDLKEHLELQIINIEDALEMDEDEKEIVKKREEEVDIDINQREKDLNIIQKQKSEQKNILLQYPKIIIIDAFKKKRKIHLTANECIEGPVRKKHKSENVICKICFNNDINSVISTCGHPFCDECIKRINKCAICNKKFYSEHVIKLYIC